MSKLFGLSVAALLCAFPAYAEQKCVLQRMADMPVTMAGTRPLISGTINGQPARFLADSGAFFSFLSRESATRYGVRIGPLPPQFRVRGTGGTERMALGKAAKFALDGFGGGYVFSDVDFLVGSNALIRGGVAGIIGQNVIGTADAEYDLANGFIRLFRAKDCDGTMLAYWAKNASVAEVSFERRTAVAPHLIGEATLNGKKIRVMFDTGASRSVLTLKAAKRAGITPEDDEVSAAGIGRGIGKKTNENWLGRFDTLDIGGEQIKNARLHMSDITIGDSVDMLLGADFFLSHRAYVAIEDRKIYFTYNGGPVFDLRRDGAPSLSATEDESEGEREDASAGSTETLSAAELRRRGMASIGRRDIQAGIADFDRAIQLDANDPESYFQRGTAHWQSGRPLLAMSDFEQALKIKPDHVPSLLSRGAMRLARKDKAGATVDLDAAIGLSKDAEVPLRVARTFQTFGEYDEAIARYDAWEKQYPKDDRLPMLLNDRCWSRAMANRELDRAIADCDLALRKGLRNSAVYDSRAFAHLRHGNFDKAIADYDSALKLQPKSAVSLYGRGLAELKKGMKAEGEADIKAARELDANVGQMYGRVGVAP
jgi:tetratricopeptide (TPR) repeat protein/predicted aspartyl protease